MLTPVEDLLERRSLAENWFRKKARKHKENTEDFGAYCVEQWLSGRDSRTDLDWLRIDYLRKHLPKYGGRGSCDLSDQGNKRIQSHRDEPGFVWEEIGNDSSELKRYFESSLLRHTSCPKQERAYLILYYEWGLKVKEIADVHGTTENYAYQVLRRAEAWVKKRLLLDKRFCDDYSPRSELRK